MTQCVNFLRYTLRKCFQQPNCINPTLNLDVWSLYFRKAIERVQCRLTKWIHQFPLLPHDDRLSRIHLTPPEYRRLRGDLIFTYRTVHNTYSVNMSNIFILNASESLHGHNFKLYNERCKTPSWRNFIVNQVFNAWNNLPGNIVNALSTNAFKNCQDADVNIVWYTRFSNFSAYHFSFILFFFIYFCTISLFFQIFIVFILYLMFLMTGCCLLGCLCWLDIVISYHC